MGSKKRTGRRPAGAATTASRQRATDARPRCQGRTSAAGRRCSAGWRSRPDVRGDAGPRTLFPQAGRRVGRPGRCSVAPAWVGRRAHRGTGPGRAVPGRSHERPELHRVRRPGVIQVPGRAPCRTMSGSCGSCAAARGPAPRVLPPTALPPAALPPAALPPAVLPPAVLPPAVLPLWDAAPDPPPPALPTSAAAPYPALTGSFRRSK